MTCDKCGKEINKLNHFFVPVAGKKDGFRYCIQCAREIKIVTLA